MPVNFKIHVTKEIIAQCMYVGVFDRVDTIGDKCPIKVAIKHIFNEAHVSNLFIFPYGKNIPVKIELPVIAQNFINLFDSLCGIPKTRLIIPSFEFDIEIPDDAIDRIDIRDLNFLNRPALVKCEIMTVMQR